MPEAQTTRVIVCLPYNRPEVPLEDPPRIEWNAEKAKILWEVIARSRASDSGGADWKGLAAHLQVPLPYLLYRAQTRYEEDLRGLQDIRGVFSPPAPPPSQSPDDPALHNDKPSLTLKISSRTPSGSAPLSSSTRLSSPLVMRARLNSLGSHTSRSPKVTSSSTITLQGPRKTYMPLRQASLPPSDSDSEDEVALKEEEAERQLEEQEALAKKLSDLQKMMTSDALGLVRPIRRKSKGKDFDRGRLGPISFKTTPTTHTRDEVSSRSHSLSTSPTNSPQNSIPSLPSPPLDSQRDSPIRRHMSPGKSSSPPAVSQRSARGQSHMRYGPLVPITTTADQGSEVGSNPTTSSASSFSDLSEASLSASALESALMYNPSSRGGTAGSRLSVFARSRYAGRSRGVRL